MQEYNFRIIITGYAKTQQFKFPLFKKVWHTIEYIIIISQGWNRLTKTSPNHNLIFSPLKKLPKINVLYIWTIIFVQNVLKMNDDKPFCIDLE